MNIDAYKDQVWQFILARGIPLEDAEDIFQEVWIALWQQKDKHPNLKALAFQIARNKVVDYWRRKKTTTSIYEPATMEIEARHSQTIETIQNQLNDIFLRAKLKEEQATLITLRHILGYSTLECSDIIGLPEETIRSRLKAARKQLRKRANLDTLLGGMV